jgi:Holliday junction resolvase-like predicted endonuclease
VHLAPRLAARALALQPRELGLVGEIVAARALRAAGWRVHGRRACAGGTEFDLLAQARGARLAVEVKCGRAGPRWRPFDRWDPLRRRRQRRALSGAGVALWGCEVRLEPDGALVLGWCAADGRRRPWAVPGAVRDAPPAPPPSRDGR